MSKLNTKPTPTPTLEIRREVRFRIHGKVKRGELVIGDLRKVHAKEKPNAWACSWMLSETDPTPRDIYGEDGLSALLNCLAFLNAHIQNYAESGIEIWWLEKGDNAGLKTLVADLM
jgi:hypothetical protein